MNIKSKITIPVTVLGIVLLLSASFMAQAQLEQTDLPINAAIRTQVIEAVLSRLNESYVLPEIAAQMEQSIRARMQKGEYDRIASSSVLAQTLTNHLAEIAKDKHLGVGFSNDLIPISKAAVSSVSPVRRVEAVTASTELHFIEDVYNLPVGSRAATATRRGTGHHIRPNNGLYPTAK